jgi:hypothetical protein
VKTEQSQNTSSYPPLAHFAPVRSAVTGGGYFSGAEDMSVANDDMRRLSTRVLNVLNYAGVSDVPGLLRLDFVAFTARRNVGAKVMAEIAQFVVAVSKPNVENLFPSLFDQHASMKEIDELKEEVQRMRTCLATAMSELAKCI